MAISLLRSVLIFASHSGDNRQSMPGPLYVSASRFYLPEFISAGKRYGTARPEEGGKLLDFTSVIAYDPITFDDRSTVNLFMLRSKPVPFFRYNSDHRKNSACCLLQREAQLRARFLFDVIDLQCFALAPSRQCAVSKEAIPDAFGVAVTHSTP